MNSDFSCSQSRIDKFLTSLGLWKLMYKYLHKMLGTCTPVNVHVEVETNYFFHELIKVFLNEDSKYLNYPADLRKRSRAVQGCPQKFVVLKN